MEFAFVVDPLESLKAYKDSSVAMMRCAQARGHTLFAIEQPEIFWDNGTTRARVRALEVGPDDDAWYRVDDSIIRSLQSFSAVLMRKDPPFDMRRHDDQHKLAALLEKLND